jgi:CDP-diacylglycerol---glycerol-3-phosphate 3-phosphatidyltransferase
MARIFSVVSRAGLARVFDPLARALVRAGVSPDAVTVIGSAGIVAAAIGLAARGWIISATLVITLVAFTDMLDGAMARISGRTNRFGALLDSTMDRISDGAVFGALAYWQATLGQRWSLVAALICLVTGQVISYVRARAEGLGFAANVGIAERAERLVIVGLGGLGYGFGFHPAMAIALWVLAALSVITIGQRLLHVWRQARAAETVEAAR